MYKKDVNLQVYDVEFIIFMSGGVDIFVIMYMWLMFQVIRVLLSMVLVFLNEEFVVDEGNGSFEVLFILRFDI